MAKEKNLVEDALIQMKNLEEAVAENAKGILASTMKQEIRELVKESIVSEQGDDDEEIEKEPKMDDDELDDEEFDDFEFPETGDNDDDEPDFDMSGLGMSDDDDDDDDRVIDLSGTDDEGNQLIPDEDVLKVFLSMKATDGIIVKKDNEMVNLKDNNTDKEYMIQMESAEGDDYPHEYTEDDNYPHEYTEYNDELGEGTVDDVINRVFSKNPVTNKEPKESYRDVEETIYEIEVDDEDGDMRDFMMSDEDDEDDKDDFDMSVLGLSDDDEDLEEDSEYFTESMKPKIGSGAQRGKLKPSPIKKTSGGFKENMKQGTRGVGMGKPKFEFKEGMNKEKMGDTNPMRKKSMMSKGTTPVFSSGKKEETKEASRTFSFGPRGLRKGITPNRNLKLENEQKYEEQIKVLREKNEEYRKALNVFRDKLNEVATFNSNLAYATRLFTEHSTSKQEKINILRRFDDVETIKESKNLYRTIKSELTTTNKTSITESIEGKIERTPSSGSASTLIESKTYENPQFLRMKDIMSKIIK